MFQFVLRMVQWIYLSVLIIPTWFDKSSCLLCWLKKVQGKTFSAFIFGINITIIILIIFYVGKIFLTFSDCQSQALSDDDLQVVEKLIPKSTDEGLSNWPGAVSNSTISYA